MKDLSTIQTQRTAAAIGAVILLVAILAMFTAPRSAGPFSRPPPPAAPAAQTPSLPDLTLGLILGLFAVGLVGGTFGGMLGMGGGVIKMSSLLLFFGLHPGVSRFAALFSYSAVALGASYRYHKLRLVRNDVVKILVPASIAGLGVGAIVGHHLSREAMLFLLGMFLLFTTIVMVKRILSHRLEQHAGGAGASGGRCTCRPTAWRVALSGFPGGFLCTMLGVSGGVVTTPLQQVLAGIPIKSAIANTLFKAAITVPIGCLLILILGTQTGHFDLWHPIVTALCLVPGSIIGSQVGPLLTARMSQFMVHAAFGALTLALGIYLLFFAH